MKYKQKLHELEIKLNSKTNGFVLFKEALGPSVPGSEMKRSDAGLEADTNIMPPTEHEFDENLDFPNRIAPKDHDSINGLGLADNNIGSPTEHEFDEGLNLTKKKTFKPGDKVIVANIPENIFSSTENGRTGVVGVNGTFFEKGWDELATEVIFPHKKTIDKTISLRIPKSL